MSETQPQPVTKPVEEFFQRLADKETHDLAVSVVNDGGHYSERVANHAKMKRGAYRGYIRSLCWNQARHEKLYFGRRWTDKDIDTATDDVVEHMEQHIKDLGVSA